MDISSHIFVAGHQGMIGSAILRHFVNNGYKNLLVREKALLDLSDTQVTNRFFMEHQPEYVVLAAGRTGGIMENKRAPADFLYSNLAIGLSVLHAAHRYGVKKLIFLGSSCMYPAHCPQPMGENLLLTGMPEETSLGTAIGKLAGTQLCLSYNQQYGDTRFIPVIPNNAYGPYDDFNPATGHVLSVLIHRFHKAKITGAKTIELWGSGTPKREFIHADDIASACAMLLNTELAGQELPINIGVGQDISIYDLAKLIASVVGFGGEIVWDTQKPDGAPRKLLDSSRIHNMGWKHAISLEDGIRNTYHWYLDNQAGAEMEISATATKGNNG